MNTLRNVVYITGYGRSGSTLLDRLLGQMPGYVSCGELEKIWTYGVRDDNFCTCGVSFSKCEFWSEVIRDLFGGQDKVPVDTILRWKRTTRLRNLLAVLMSGARTKEFDSDLSAYVALWGSLLDSILKVSARRVVVDSSKTPHQLFALRNIPNTSLRVVQLIRDSRAVAYSMSRKKPANENASSQRFIKESGALGSSMAWLQWNLLAELYGRVDGGHLKIKYEEFIPDPARAVRSIAEFTDGSKPELPFIHDASAEVGEGHLIAGNPMRFEKGTLRLKIDDEWRSSMGRGKRALVTTLTYPLLRSYGYAE